MADFINREAAIEVCCKECNLCRGDEPCEPSDCIFYRALLYIPAADVRLAVRGEWVLYKDRDNTGKFDYVQWSCSSCKAVIRSGKPRFDSTLRERPWYNYCPNCGADMRPDLPKEET